MKTADIKLNTDYLILPPWLRHNKTDRDPDRVERNRGVSAKVMTMDKYKPAQHYNTSNDGFDIAEKGERTIAYLCYADDLGRWFVVRPQDIVGDYAIIEARWVVEEAEAKKQREEQHQREQAQRAREQAIRDSIDRDIRGIKDTFVTVLQGRVNAEKLSANYYYNRTDEVPTMTVAINDMVRFIEKYLELQDELA